MERFLGKICSHIIMCRKARIDVTKCPFKSLLKSPLWNLRCTVSLCVSLSSRVTSTLDDLYMLYFSSQVLVKWARSQWTRLSKSACLEWVISQLPFGLFFKAISGAYLFIWKLFLRLRGNENKFSYEGMSTGTRFEKEVGNGLLEISLSAFTQTLPVYSQCYYYVMLRHMWRDLHCGNWPCEVA